MDNKVGVRQGLRWGKKSASAVGIAAGLMVLFKIPLGVGAILGAVIVGLMWIAIAWGAGFAFGYVMSQSENSLPTPPIGDPDLRQGQSATLGTDMPSQFVGHNELKNNSDRIPASGQNLEPPAAAPPQNRSEKSQKIGINKAGASPPKKTEDHMVNAANPNFSKNAEGQSATTVNESPSSQVRHNLTVTPGSDGSNDCDDFDKAAIYYPQLRELEDDLARYGENAQARFRQTVISEKEFKNAAAIRDRIKAACLQDEYGDDPRVHNLAEALIRTQSTYQLQELKDAVRILGRQFDFGIVEKKIMEGLRSPDGPSLEHNSPTRQPLAPTDPPGPSFTVGTMVSHKTYGKGEVIGSAGKRFAVVLFEGQVLPTPVAEVLLKPIASVAD